MKIKLTVNGTSCTQGFITSGGYKFLLPGQEFKPVSSDQIETNKCPELYEGIEIIDKIICRSGTDDEGEHDAILFVVLDNATELPIEGAFLEVMVSTDVVFSATTDFMGRAVYDAAPGIYDHQAGAEGYAASPIGTVELEEGNFELVTIRLDREADSGCDFVLSLNLWTYNSSTGHYTTGFTNLGPDPVIVSGFFLNSAGASIVSVSPPLGTVINALETMSYTVNPGAEVFTGAAIITTCDTVVHDFAYGGGDNCHLHAGLHQTFFPDFTQKIVLRNTGSETMTVTIEPPEDTGDWVLDIDPGPYVLSPDEINEVPFSLTFDNGPDPDPPRFPLNPTINLHTNNCGDYSLYLGTTLPPYGVVIVHFVWENEGSTEATFSANSEVAVEGGGCPPDICLPMTEGKEDSYSSGDTGDVKVTTDVVSLESGFPEDHIYGVHGHANVSLATDGAIGSFTVTVLYDNGDGVPMIMDSWKHTPVNPLSSVSADVVVTPSPWIQDPNSEEVSMIPSGPATVKVTFGSAL